MLGLVFILFYEALKPQNWQWIAPGKQPTASETTSPPPIPLIESPAPSDELKGKLAEVRDDTLQIRPAEQPIYLEFLREAEEKDWGAAISSEQPPYPDVMKNLPALRGTIISASGKLRRLLCYDVTTPSTTVSLYEGWFFTPESGNHPWVVHFSVPPSGVAPGNELDLPISVTGLLFKTYQYESKVGLSSAPLLITDQVRISHPIDTKSTAPSPSRNLIPIAVLLLGLIVIMKYVTPEMYGPLRRRKPRCEEIPDRIELPADPPLSEVKDLWEGEADSFPPPNENNPSGEN